MKNRKPEAKNQKTTKAPRGGKAGKPAANAEPVADEAIAEVQAIPEAVETPETEAPVAEVPAAEDATPELDAIAEPALVETPVTETLNAEIPTAEISSEEAPTAEVVPTPTEAPAPKPAKKAKEKKPKAEKPKKLSALDAAAQVLAESAEPLTCVELIEQMKKKGLWESAKGLTPDATLNAALHKEIKVKGADSRFVKADRGKFALAASK